MSLVADGFDADLLICGGGCAGLSLAGRLATACPELKVIVVEPRTHYVEDRTWCGWRTASHPYLDCVTASWSQWRVKSHADTILRGSEIYPYEMISAGRFYERSCEMIRSSSSIYLSLASTVDSFTEDSTGVTACLGGDKSLRARWAVDTRPKPLQLEFPFLWQNFVGYEIQGDQGWTERLGPTPMLMDFQPARSSVLQFMYVLPLGDHRFLCELTRFSSIYGESDEIEVELQGWLRGNGCQEGMVGRREAGSLPMSVVAAPNFESRIVPAGTLGGSMRASTGYAFHSIQRWAERCTEALAAGYPPVSPTRNSILNFLDEVFLTALQDRSLAPETVFTRLFERTQPEALVRFLSNIPQSGDIVPVMRSLPWIPFSKAALQTMLRKGAAL
jgi:lycopene beta-cyclase